MRMKVRLLTLWIRARDLLLDLRSASLGGWFASFNYCLAKKEERVAVRSVSGNLKYCILPGIRHSMQSRGYLALVVKSDLCLLSVQYTCQALSLRVQRSLSSAVISTSVAIRLSVTIERCID